MNPMKLLLSDNQLHLRFAPLTLTRPVAELRCGLFTNTERYQQLLPGVQIGYQTEMFGFELVRVLMYYLEIKDTKD